MEKEKTAAQYGLFYHFGILLLAAFLTFNLAGCTGGVEEPEVDLVRAKDSADVYFKLGKAFADYQSALRYNQNSQDSEARHKFEDAVKNLSSVNKSLLSSPGNFVWKKDYQELSTSVVQDYLTTQENIPEGSPVFKLAKEVAINYESVKEFDDNGEDIEPLPTGTQIPLEKNAVVDEFIEFWTKTERGKNFVDKTVYRSGKFYPLMRKILKYHNAPEELIYLSTHESGLNPTIISRSGAVGLWQFMPSTGAAYGLFQDGMRDDRRDFEKSTDAAARHLKDLYRSFNDWYLAFAAYNAGPGRVNSAIRNAGSRNFWDIRPYLPAETRDYVPYILALSYVIRNPEQYGFSNLEYAKPLSFDRVNVQGSLTFDQIANYTGSDVETIRELNPELMSDMVPDYSVPYHLRIPLGTYETFAGNLQKSGLSSPEFAGQEKFNSGNVASLTFRVNGYQPNDPRKIGTTGANKTEYIVLTDEPLSTIAVKNSVRATDIRMWNSLPYGKNPTKNQKLIIYKADKTSGDNSPVNNDRFLTDNIDDLQSTVNTDVSSFKQEEQLQDTGINSVPESTGTEIPEVSTETSIPEGKKQTYTVKAGDYLSTLARDFGVTIDDLKSWNNLQTDVLKSGQKLVIYSDKAPIVESNTKPSYHVVASGETLSLIAKKYGLTMNEIKSWNNMKTDVVKSGQKLVLKESKNTVSTTSNKKDSKIYTVGKGDILSVIAKENGLTINQIMQWNNLSDSTIKAGQKLKLYDDGSSKKNTKKDTTSQKRTRRRQ